MLNGQLAPDGGIVRLEGRDIVGLRPRADLAAGRRPHLPDHRDLRLDDGARERADGAATRTPAGCARCSAASARPSPTEADALLDHVGMLDQADRACGVLAYGDLKRVELAMALANQPRLLLMDEPTAGMAPKERVALMELAAGLARARADRRAVHRARHGRGVRPCRPHHRARPRPADRRRHAAGGARRSRGAGGLSRSGIDVFAGARHSVAHLRCTP